MTAPDGSLHMRYTHRKRNIRWRDDPLTREAVAFLATLLTPDNPHCFQGTLQSGQGLLCNNVLHTRTGFEENSPRLLYRGRYFDRIRLP
jgi:alpha-ketoglutarate-dependent taurine dioxygenase